MEATKKAKVIFHKSLQDFFKANYPEIKLASEVKKNTLINKLATSGSFATTHLVIDKLATVDDFSPAEVEQLIQIAEMNNQVGWIISDVDVLAFYQKLKDKHWNDISAESLETLNQLLPDKEQQEEVDDVFS